MVGFIIYPLLWLFFIKSQLHSWRVSGWVRYISTIMALKKLHGGDLVVGFMIFPLLWLFPITHWRISGWVRHMSTIVAFSWATNPTPESILNLFLFLFLSLSACSLRSNARLARVNEAEERSTTRLQIRTRRRILVSDWILSCAFNLYMLSCGRVFF